MPIWAVFLCVGISIACVLPIGIIVAVTGQQLYLNVLTEFVIGLMIPGKTIAVMAFKSLGTNCIIQAINLISDLKLGHYMKINPIHMTAAQFYGTLVGAIVNTTVSLAALDFLGPLISQPRGQWNANSYATFYNAGAIWGAIGPQRFFGIGSTYQGCLLGFPIGFALPFLPWLGNRFYPSQMWRLINIPLIASFGSPGKSHCYGCRWLPKQSYYAVDCRVYFPVLLV